MSAIHSPFSSAGTILQGIINTFTDFSTKGYAPQNAGLYGYGMYNTGVGANSFAYKGVSGILPGNPLSQSLHAVGTLWETLWGRLTGVTDDETAARQLETLKKSDEWVKAHETAHDKAAGPYSKGIHYNSVVGPDGKPYATSGYVSIDTTIESTPKEAKAKAIQLKKAAMAPKEPSPQDYIVAAIQDGVVAKVESSS